ncbi:MAG TPA: hypothetical protein DEP23_10450, partial [Ruminococcaceae bacterium]|nr:hypothetical protein [Oscillospiraceae bacterium]
EQQGCLQEGCQAQGNDLLTPLIETVSITTGNAEKIERPDRHLDEQYPTPFYIGEKYFNHAIS